MDEITLWKAELGSGLVRISGYILDYGPPDINSSKA